MAELQHHFDGIIVGGGLAGGLLAYRLWQTHPHLNIALVERADKLGGNHTWCFHQTDIGAQSLAWLKPLVSHKWPGYDVHFPKYSKTFESPYYAIKSDDWHQKISQALSNKVFLNTSITCVESNTIQTASGQKCTADFVVDARGWNEKSLSGNMGYQKFLGLDTKLKNPHGQTRVLLKDAKIPQNDGYHFIYILPWDERSLLIEDTYYSNDPALNFDRSREFINSYLGKCGWQIQEIIREETGCLPLPLDQTSKGSYGGAISLGARSGLFHDVTGYTFPFLIKTIESLTELQNLNSAAMSAAVQQLQRDLSWQQSYLRLLNRMMFRAAKPDKRYKILERFYELSPALIERFYAGKLELKDQLRILWGRPPVPFFKALASLSNFTKAPFGSSPDQPRSHS